MSKALAIYVVYFDPLDFPGRYVLRRWLAQEPDPIPMAVTAELALVRNVIPDHCIPIGSYPEQDPKIFEVWV